MAALAALLAASAPSAAHAEGALRTWTLSGTFRRIQSSNLFPFLFDGPGDSIGTPSLSLSYFRTTPKNSFSATLSGYTSRYSEQTQYSRLGGAVQLGGSHRFSQRVRTGYSLGVNSGLPTESIYLSRTLFPQIDVNGRRGAMHLSYDVSRTTIATVDVGGYTSRFNSAIPVLGVSIDPSLVPPAFFPGLTEAALAGPLGPQAQIDPALFALSILGSEGLIAGESDFRLFGGGFGLTHSFSPVLSGTVWVGYSRIDVLSSRSVEGGRVDARGTLSRRFGPSTRLSFTYANERNHATVPETTNQTFVVQGDKAFNENVEFSASLGYGALGSPVSSFGGTLLGGVGLTSRRGSNSLRLRYDRTTFQAFGLGRNQVTDVGYANLGRSLSRRLTVWLNGHARESRDPFEGRFSVKQQTFGTGLSYRFHERTMVGTDYNIIRWTPLGGTESLDSTIWSVFVSYGKSFR